MVRLENLLILSLNLVHARSQDGHLGAAVLQRNTGNDSASYASNLKRLHHTVRRARSIIEDRDASIPVPESELHSILAKIEDLENQVKALLQGGDASSASAAAGSRSGTSANHDSSDQDCDADNSSHDLGARAVVDSDGKVSGHSLFRRNANCSMKSAVKGKKDGEAGVPSGESPGSGPDGSGSDGDSSETGTESPEDSPEEPSSTGSSRVNSSSPATVVAADDTSAESSGSPEASDVMDEETSSSMPNQKNVLQGDIPTKASATAAADTIPTQDVSATREHIEIQTLPVNGEYITTTVTSTRTRLSTVAVAMKHSSTGVAQKAEMEDNKPTSPTVPVTETNEGPDSADTDEPSTVASPPSVGGFRKYTNGTTTVERVSNGTTENKIVSGNKDKNVAAAQAPSKQAQDAVPDAKPSSPQKNQPNLAKSGSNASNVTQPEAVNRVHEKLMSLVAPGARLESSNASRTAGGISETAAQPTAVERFVNGTVADKFFNSTSQESAPSSKPDQNREPGSVSPQVKIVSVVPVRPKPSGGGASAWTVPPTAKPGPSSSVTGPANVTSVRPLSGFKTIRTPQSRHSMNVERRDERS
ncbi:hypothetical protein EsDP_00005255 [Epichloe bromicola]|uniref:Uncharacterized protein n=1 Tax=Epichloe bromicola TaxID=79588 RepID=A0ABQ0CU44_9HYPO